MSSNDSGPTSLDPSKFPNLKRIHCLNSGPFDDLFRVRDMEEQNWTFGRFYSAPIQPQLVTEFEQHVQAVAEFQHPSVIQLFKCVGDGNFRAIIWEYVDGSTFAERMHRELSPRLLAKMMLEITQCLMAGQERNIRFEYLGLNDILIDLEGHPHLFAGAFSHMMEGRNDSTGTVANYDRRALARLGAILLTVSFGRENIELIQAVQLESDIKDLMFRFTDLMDIDPNLMAIIAKCLMSDGIQYYQRLPELEKDLSDYLSGRAVALDGVNFYEMIKRWNLRKNNS